MCACAVALARHPRFLLLSTTHAKNGYDVRRIMDHVYIIASDNLESLRVVLDVSICPGLSVKVPNETRRLILRAAVAGVGRQDRGQRSKRVLVT